MGLLLSILVFSVGVLETLACVRHIQQGILPAWAPRHVTSASGRRLLREHWRKSTSQDDGSGDVLRLSADGGLLPNGAPSRRRLSERKGSLDDDLVARPRPPPLTLGESPHHVRSPDIHWPDPVPHSPVKCIEQKLPSPVAEVPGDAPAWPSEAPPALQKRRTSKTEILPHEEQRQALPLRDATPDPSFAREAREPPRLKPAKASSFEEARIEPFAPPEPKAPGVITITHTDHSEAGPQAAVVGRIEIKAAAEGHEDDMPAPWPIINIDTVVTSDEEGDLTPPTTTRSRRVSFDPVPTVVVIDKEKAIIEERMRGTILAPSIRITDDLESVLRKELPSVIDDIIQQALVKVNEVLECRQNGSHKGVSLVLENLVARSDKVLDGHLASVCAEEYQTNFEPKIESVFYQQKGKEIIDSIVPPEEKIYNDNEENVERRLQSVSSPAAEKKGLAPTSVSQEGPPSKSLQIDSKRTESPPRVASPSFDSDSLHTLNSRLGSLAKSCLETEAQNIADLQNEVAEKSKPTESTHAKPSKSGPQAQKGHAADLTSQEVEKTRENSQKITLEIPKENENKRVKEAEEISSETTAPVVHLDIEKTMQATSRSPHGATNETIEPTLRAVKNDIRNDNRQHSPTDTQERISKLQSTTTGEPFSEAGGAVGTCAEPVHPGTAVPPSVAAAASTPAFPDAKLPPESRDETASAPTVPTEFIAPSTEAPVESAVPNIPSLVPASAGDIFVPVTPAESTILAATDSPVSLEPSVDTISLETSSVPSAFDASPIPIPVPPDLVAPVTLVLPSPSVISAAPTALVATAAKDTFNPPFASPAVPTSSVSLDTSDDSIALTTPDAVDIAAVPTPAAAAVVAALPTSAAPVVPLIPAVSDSSTPFPSSSHDVILAASPLPVSTVDPSSHTSAASAVPSAPASPVVPITPATAFTPTSTALTVPAEDLAPAISPVSFAPDPVSDSAPAPTSVPAVTSAPSTPFPAPVPTPVPSSDVASALSSVPPPAPLKSKSSPVAPSASPVPPTSKSPAPSPAPAAGAPFKVEESSSESSSSGRSAAAGRPTAPVTNPASPQPQAQAHEAFWVSDSSSPSEAPTAVSPKATSSASKKSYPGSPKTTLRTGEKKPSVSQKFPYPSTPKTPTSPWTPRTLSSVESSQSPQTAVFPKPTRNTHSPPAFAQKQFGAAATASAAPVPTALCLKQSSSPFGKVGQSAPPSFYKPASPSPAPSFLSNLPKRTSTASSRFAQTTAPSSETISSPTPDPTPATEKPVAAGSETSATPSVSVSAPSHAPGPSSPSKALPPVTGSSRPSSPPLSRDPQEVVRRLAELRRTDPTVASEVLLSILGFRFPGS